MQYCGSHKLKKLRVQADISADPLWCDRCLTNLDIDDFSLSKGLKQDLQEWIYDYGKWIDWENDGIVPNGVLLEQQHNDRGAELTKKVKQALEGQYEVVFFPSTFAKTLVGEL